MLKIGDSIHVVGSREFTVSPGEIVDMDEETFTVFRNEDGACRVFPIGWINGVTIPSDKPPMKSEEDELETG